VWRASAEIVGYLRQKELVKDSKKYEEVKAIAVSQGRRWQVGEREECGGKEKVGR